MTMLDQARGFHAQHQVHNTAHTAVEGHYWKQGDAEPPTPGDENKLKLVVPAAQLERNHDDQESGPVSREQLVYVQIKDVPTVKPMFDQVYCSTEDQPTPRWRQVIGIKKNDGAQWCLHVR